MEEKKEKRELQETTRDPMSGFRVVEDHTGRFHLVDERTGKEVAQMRPGDTYEE